MKVPGTKTLKPKQLGSRWVAQVSQDKKKQLLLHFLRTGQAVEQWLERKPKAQNRPSLASWRWCRIFHRHLNILNDIHLGSHTLCSSKPERRPRGMHPNHSMDSFSSQLLGQSQQLLPTHGRSWRGASLLFSKMPIQG